MPFFAQVELVSSGRSASAALMPACASSPQAWHSACSNHAGLFRRLKKRYPCDMPILPSQASPTMPSLLLPPSSSQARVSPGSPCNPAAERLRARRGSQGLHRFSRPDEARGLHRLRQQAPVGHPLYPLHAQIRARRTTRPPESTHATACLRNKTLKGHLQRGDPQARGGRARLPVVGALGMGDEGQAVYF